MIVVLWLLFGVSLAWVLTRRQHVALWRTALAVVSICTLYAVGRVDSQNGFPSAGAASPQPENTSWAVDRSTPDPNYCGRAHQYQVTATGDYNANEFRDAYKNATSGLSVDENCADESDHLVNEAYLMTVKALAEHHLSVGDSRTDLNQADMLLERCITKPGLYATQTGAGCETQQHINSGYETDWDLGR